MTDSDKSIFRFVMFWIKKLHREFISPDGLCFFKPDAMFLKILSIFLIIPFEPYN